MNKINYALIPMNEITDEARMIAVQWHENATNWIGDKHKLASDIMNYAKQFQANTPIEIRKGITNTKVSIQNGKIIVEPNIVI